MSLLRYVVFDHHQSPTYQRLSGNSTNDLVKRQKEISIKGPMDFFRYISSNRWEEDFMIGEILLTRNRANHLR